MTMTETREGAPVVGVFDDEALARRGVERLHDLGFDDNAMHVAQREVVVEEEDEAPVPSSLSGPYALVASLVAGAACGVAGGLIGPPTITTPGFGWVINTVLLLALTGGLFGWVLGGILGFGTVSREEQDDIPEDAVEPRIATTVSLRAPGRSEEARIVLRSAGAYAVMGGEAGHRDAPTSQRLQQRPSASSPYRRDTGTVRPLPRGTDAPAPRPGLLSRILGAARSVRRLASSRKRK